MLVFVLSACLASCMRASPPDSPITPEQPAPDSLTVALWRMDERSGTRVVDAGPLHLDGTAGRITLTQFGRVGRSRSLRPEIDSFIHVPYNAAFDLPAAITVEAWLFVRNVGRYEDTPIAGRWTQESNRQSWLFTLGGQRLGEPVVEPGPGYHLELVNRAMPRHLWFAYQPETAGPPRTFVSIGVIELERWTHVAATFDGELVRFYIDGELDVQFASSGRIRRSDAPLLVGNYFDPRLLTSFGGDLHPETADTRAPYAFDGLIDELRISRAARSEFPRRAQ